MSLPSLGTCSDSSAHIYSRALATNRGILECVTWHLHIGVVSETVHLEECMLSITSGAKAGWRAGMNRHHPLISMVTVKTRSGIIHPFLVWLDLRQTGLEYLEPSCVIREVVPTRRKVLRHSGMQRPLGLMIIFLLPPIGGWNDLPYLTLP